MQTTILYRLQVRLCIAGSSWLSWALTTCGRSARLYPLYPVRCPYPRPYKQLTKLAIGFNVETVQVRHDQRLGTIVITHTMKQYKNIKFQVWDLGGQSSIRYVTPARPHYRSPTRMFRSQALRAVLLPEHVRHHLRHRLLRRRPANNISHRTPHHAL